MADYYEGQIKENPETGAQVVFMGGQWRAVPSTYVAAPESSTEQTQPDYAGLGKDLAKSAAVAPIKTAISLAGTPGDVVEAGAELSSAAKQTAAEKLGYKNYEPPRQPQEPPYGTAYMQRQVEGLTGPLYEPQTKPGDWLTKAALYSPALFGGWGGAGLGARALLGVGAPLVGGELAGAFTDNPWTQMGAAMLAPAIARRAISPGMAMAERLAQAGKVEKELGPISAARKTGLPLQASLEERIGAPAGMEQEELQRKFGSAMLKRGAAEGESTINPETGEQDIITTAKRNLGKTLQPVLERNFMHFDRPYTMATDAENNISAPLTFRQRAQQISDNYKDVYGSIAKPEELTALDKEIAGVLAPGAPEGKPIGYRPINIRGTRYQAMRSKWSQLADSLPEGSGLGRALRQLRGAADDAFLASVPPEDRPIVEDFRRQYTVAKGLQRASEGASPAAAAGYLAPGAVYQALKGKGAAAGDATALARASQAILAPLKPSKHLDEILAGVGGLGGMAYGATQGESSDPGWMNTAEGGLWGAVAVPSMVRALLKVGGPLLNTRGGQAWLANQAMTGTKVPSVLRRAVPYSAPYRFPDQEVSDQAVQQKQ